MSFNVGEKVEWNWSRGTAQGEIEKIFESDVTRTIKGTEVTRNASPEEPAYLIVQSDGDKVLKSASELSAN